MTALALALYAAALVVANLTVAAFGPIVTPVNAFFLIGLDLALRNWLALRITTPKMIALIGASALLSYGLNPASGQIALASLIAFTLSALADWGTFASLSGRWTKRSICGVTVGALVDSLVFPTVAFGALLPAVVAAQFAAKLAGGALWTLMLSRKAEAA